MTGLRWFRTWRITWHGYSFGPGRYTWNEAAGRKIKTALDADLERMYQHRDRPNLMPQADAEELVARYDIALWEQQMRHPGPMPDTDMPLRQPWDGSE